MRNYHLLDYYTYSPNYKTEAKRYSIFAQSKESTLSGEGSVFKGKKIDIIKLNDEYKVNPYKQSVLPLTMEANISNLLFGQPFMNIIS